jgi:CHAD domain-containing protein
MTENVNTFVMEEVQRRPPAGKPRAIDDRGRLGKMLAKQQRNFTVLFARVLAEEDADPVHDLRVATRRLQEILAALVTDMSVNKARSVRRTLRRVRRALGPWRNCDVALEWAARGKRRCSHPTRKQGWTLLLDSIAAQREDAIRMARRRLYKSGGITLNHRIGQLLTAAAARPASISPGGAVRAAVAGAAARWREALERAQAERSVVNVHALRIASKRLRYGIELSHDLGAGEAAAQIAWFKLLQDRLGHWHDRQELTHFITHALVGSGVMAAQPRVAIELLRQVEKDIKISSHEVEELFKLTADSEGSRHLSLWLESYCGANGAGPATPAAEVVASTASAPGHANGEPSQEESPAAPETGGEAPN